MENELLDPEDPAYVNVNSKLKDIVGNETRCKLSKLAKKVTKILKNAALKGEETPDNVGQEAFGEGEMEHISSLQMRRRLDLSFQELPLHQVQGDKLSVDPVSDIAEGQVANIENSIDSLQSIPSIDESALETSTSDSSLEPKNEVSNSSSDASMHTACIKRKFEMDKAESQAVDSEYKLPRASLSPSPTKRLCIVTSDLGASQAVSGSPKGSADHFMTHTAIDPMAVTRCPSSVQALAACATHTSVGSVSLEDDLDDDDLRILEVWTPISQE